MSFTSSQNLESLLKKLVSQSLTLGEILAETSERAFSLMISLLTLPFLFPMPPGLSTVLGMGCLILALQMGIGRRTPWLPKRIARFRFPRGFTLQLLKNFQRVTYKFKTMIRPRWLSIARNSYVWRANGLCIAWMTILLMLPIPLTNPLPATGILFLAIATLESDGLLICLGYGLTLLNTVFFAFIGYALWQTPALLPNF